MRITTYQLQLRFTKQEVNQKNFNKKVMRNKRNENTEENIKRHAEENDKA